METTFAAGSVWKYTDDGIDLGTAWKELAFDDSTWKSGAGQLGYGDGDETTVMFNGGTVPADRYISHYLRRSVTLSDVSELNGVTLSVLRDDGVVVYVNGVEAFRDNMPAGTITNTTFASTAVTDAAESTYYDFAIPPSMFHDGTNVIAVSLHNESRQGTGDISFDARLTSRYGPVLVAAAHEPPQHRYDRHLGRSRLGRTERDDHRVPRVPWRRPGGLTERTPRSPTPGSRAPRPTPTPSPRSARSNESAPERDALA